MCQSVWPFPNFLCGNRRRIFASGYRHRAGLCCTSRDGGTNPAWFVAPWHRPCPRDGRPTREKLGRDAGGLVLPYRFHPIPIRFATAAWHSRLSHSNNSDDVAFRTMPCLCLCLCSRLCSRLCSCSFRVVSSGEDRTTHSAKCFESPPANRHRTARGVGSGPPWRPIWTRPASPRNPIFPRIPGVAGPCSPRLPSGFVTGTLVDRALPRDPCLVPR
mmetsp:Transcript_3287/g.7106  ORF Transcript_3287/g.7106 Transcript_3287/m.7106 type:complete len:216 (+) Transcript_3287:1633-2280(+)